MKTLAIKPGTDQLISIAPKGPYFHDGAEKIDLKEGKRFFVTKKWSQMDGATFPVVAVQIDSFDVLNEREGEVIIVRYSLLGNEFYEQKKGNWLPIGRFRDALVQSGCVDKYGNEVPEFSTWIDYLKHWIKKIMES